METAFTGSSQTKHSFDLSLVQLDPKRSATVNGTVVRPFLVNHGPSGGPCFAYRFEVDGRFITYSGDTEWTDELVAAGGGVDLFISEAYCFEKKVKHHLDLATLQNNLSRIQPKRLVLTHMSEDMLNRVELSGYETAEDGMIITL